MFTVCVITAIFLYKADASDYSFFLKIDSITKNYLIVKLYIFQTSLYGRQHAWDPNSCSSTPVQSPIDIDTTIAQYSDEPDIISAPSFIADHLQGVHDVTINDVENATAHRGKSKIRTPIPKSPMS